MNDFVFHLPTKIFFGANKKADFFSELKRYGSKVLLVTGGGSIERLGYLAEVTTSLTEVDIAYKHESGIEANPIAATIDRIAQSSRDFQAEFVIALGGGSVMDATKALAALLKTGEKHIWPFCAGESKRGQFSGALPIVCIPTTAATASEVTPYAVISNPEKNGKSALAYEFFKPSCSWINPRFTLDLPATTTADGAADILSHVFENYLLGGANSPLTDRYCESVMRTVIETLPQVIKDPRREDLRANLLWCSTLALNGMQGLGRGESAYVLHAMEHALSGLRHELAHGRGLATLYPSYFRWLLKNGRAEDRLAQLAVRLFDLKPSAIAFIETFEHWLKQNQLYQSLIALGFVESDYEAVAKEVLRINAPDEGVMDVLGPLGLSDIVEIFTETARQN